MDDRDQEAFQIWLNTKPWIGDHAKMAWCEEAWKTATEYKKAEIEEFLDNEDKLRIHMNSIGYRELKKLQAENKQLKTENDILSGEIITYKKMSDNALKKLSLLIKALEFYAMRKNDDPHNFWHNGRARKALEKIRGEE